MAVEKQDVEQIHNQETLFEFLRVKLGWNEGHDLDTYEYFPDELDLDEEDARHVKQILQIRPYAAEQPWAVFFVEFADEEVYKQPLRKVLGGLVPKRDRAANLPTFPHQNLLFVCAASSYQRFTFAHFRGDKWQTARVARFDWKRGDTYIHTLCRMNLDLLRWPANTADTEAWLKSWGEAFDVQSVTNAFFKDYTTVFNNFKNEVTGFADDAEMTGEDKQHLFAQTLLNRLMFCWFLQKKGWLHHKDDYLRWQWNHAQAVPNKGASDKRHNFYEEILQPLFFQALNTPNSERGEYETWRKLEDALGDVPFLNGGLFDKRNDAIPPDAVQVRNLAFDPIFTLFERYNFTVVESTPLDVEVAVDPEMLGQVFEKVITRRELRKDSGSYYTPRLIVSFMCRESLKKYLESGIGLGMIPASVTPRKIARLVDGQETVQLQHTEARALLTMLGEVKVCDPACGSGAYLLGMLHELFDLIGRLEIRLNQLTENDKYQRKQDIIQRNLYGVDKDPFAVGIAMLRLWLSLMVENQTDPLDWSQGEPNVSLPNLKFKIQQGDSLTAPDPSNLGMQSEKYSQHARHLKRLHDEYFRPKRFSRDRAKDVIETEIKEEQNKIRDLVGSAQKGALDWRVMFAEVFAEQEADTTVDGAMNMGQALAEKTLPGFDIVIANPPYGAKVEDNVRKIYFADNAEGSQAKDTYGLFMARALQMLRAGGQFCFIVSDTWRTIKSHRPLRKRLLDTTSVAHVLDLPSWIFSATVNTCIVTLTKAKPSDAHTLIAGDLRPLKAGDWVNLDANLRTVASHGVDIQTLTYARYTYLQNLIASYDNLSFFIGSPQMYTLMSDTRLEKLSNIGAAVHGISTGENDKYIRVEAGARGGYLPIEEWMKMPPDEMEKLTKEEKETGVDKDWTQLKGCFVPFEKGGESEASSGWLPNYHVPTQYYVNWAKGAISDMRNNRGVAWKNQKYFFKKGLTFSISGVYAPTFRLNSGGVFEAKGSGIFCDKVSPEVLLGLLCSRTARYLLKCYIKHTVDTSGDDINEFRFKIPNDENSSRLSRLVRRIVEKQKVEPRYPYHLHEQKEIDEIVNALYGLKPDDMREIELWYCRRYDRLAAAQGLVDEVKTKYADYLARCEYVMSQPPSYWTSHPLLRPIAEGEGLHLELKETLAVDTRSGEPKDPEKGQSLKEIAAFLNTKGGTLVIGVTDKGEVIGVARDVFHSNHRTETGMQEKIYQMVTERLSPLPDGKVTIEFVMLPGGTVCVVEVQPSDIPVYLNGDIHIREGNITKKLTTQQASDWMLNRERAKINAPTTD